MGAKSKTVERVNGMIQQIRLSLLIKTLQVGFMINSMYNMNLPEITDLDYNTATTKHGNKVYHTQQSYRVVSIRLRYSRAISLYVL